MKFILIVVIIKAVLEWICRLTADVGEEDEWVGSSTDRSRIIHPSEYITRYYENERAF